MKRSLLPILAALWLIAAATPVYGAPLQAVNPRWSEEKQQVKAPVWDMTAEEIAAARQSKTTPTGYDYLYVGHGEDSLYGADWSLSEEAGSWRYGTGTAQFQLVGPAEGQVVTAYCADLDTTSKVGWWYRVENLEDAAYYARGDAADHIRAIALTGYWGAPSGIGSLEEVRSALKKAVQEGALTALTVEDAAALTEGEALTATQIAVWKYGNPYEVITLGANTLDVGSPHWRYCDKVLKEEYGMDEADIDAALRRIDAVAAYLMGLTMTKEASGETTVLGREPVAEAALQGVRPLGEGRYEGRLTFSLSSPLQEGGALKVTLLDEQGTVLAEGRIAPGEEDSLLPDGAGNYALSGLTLTSGETLQCSLHLTGRQQLRRGVYVYTSEVRQETASQTFVGLAEGEVQVEAAQTLSLPFTPPPQGGGDPVYYPDPQPTVTSPKTGDGVTAWVLALVLSASALPWSLRRKK